MKAKTENKIYNELKVKHETSHTKHETIFYLLLHKLLIRFFFFYFCFIYLFCKKKILINKLFVLMLINL